MLREGANNFRDRVAVATKKQQLSQIGPYRRLVKEWVPILAAGIKEWTKDKRRFSGAATPLALPYIEQCDPYVASLIALRAVFDGLSLGYPRVTALAIEIGKTIEHEMQVRKWEAEEPETFYAIERMLKRDEATSGHRAKVHINRFSHHVRKGTFGFGWNPWGEEAHFRIGFTLLELIVINTGWFAMEEGSEATKRTRWNRVNYVLAPKPGLVAVIGKGLDREEVMSPALWPTLMPPKRWDGTRRGGYYTPYVMAPRLIRFKAHQETQRERAADEYDAIDMPAVYDAIHTLQEVPWAVNRRVLEVAKKAWALDIDMGMGPNGVRVGLGSLPLIGEEELPIRSGKHEAWLAKIDEFKRKHRAEKEYELPVPPKRLGEEMLRWRRSAKQVNKRNAKRVAMAKLTTTVVQMAEAFEGKTFYFPHMLDFRGRLYPIPIGLQPQGADLARGILEFAEGKPIGNTGGYWLAVSVANAWGNDKISLDDRVAWVRENEPMWRRIASDPLDSLEWADPGKDSWQLLAAIFDWVGALDGGDDYVSHRPVSVDGTCNGIQHLSAMTRDAVAGSLVNLVPAAKPQDIYQNVADKVQVEVDRLAKSRGEPGANAKYWLKIAGGKFHRSMTKRQTMVLPYGGTLDSCVGYTEEWLDEKDPAPDIMSKEEFAQRMRRIWWMGRLIWDSLTGTVSGGVAVQKWLQKCAMAVSDQDQPIFWVTPTGMVVRHFYGKLREKQIHTLLDGQHVFLAVPEYTKELDRQSQLRGIPPNFTHSIDASCLVSTINMLAPNDITAFTAVHDAYGTHAADMDKLAVILRVAFVETHKQDILGLFRNGCARVLIDQLVANGMDEVDAVEEAERRLPPRLPMGDLDIEQVLLSDYFFA